MSKQTDVDKEAKLYQDWLEYNDQANRLRSGTKTFDEYKKYRAGKYKPKLRGTPKPVYAVSNHREEYKSQNGIAVKLRREIKEGKN